MSTGGMRVFHSSMVTSFTSGGRLFMAAILHPKRPDPPMNTSAPIEASTGGPLTDGKASGRRAPQRRDWSFLRSPGSDASMPKVSWKPCRPNGVTITAWLRFILSIQPSSK